MRIHTDSITLRELHAALPHGVYLNVTEHGSRKRTRAFEVTLYLYEKDELHRRFGNSGGYGASDLVAATWDEWGVWIAALYALDPEASIGWYDSPEHFIEQTTRNRNYVRSFNKPESLAVRTHTAPWIEAARLEELRAEIRAERISYGELAELQSLVEFIDPSDVELLEWAGVPEHATA